MKLYYTKGACSLVIRIIINEIGLRCEFESVDLHTKTTEKGVDFLTINDKGSVPALELKAGKVLTENAVILQYLADDAKATQLLPQTGDFNRYRILEWVNYISTELHKSFGPLFNPTLSEETKTTFFIPLIKSKLSYVNQHLQHHTYLLGDTFTLPDAYLFVMLLWASYFKIELKKWPNLSRYFTELHSRKSIQQSLKQEAL